MTRSQFDAFCGALKGATHVEQWGNASVWKIGGRIFAICSVWGTGSHAKFSFKCSDLAYDILIEQPGIVPAPYLARAKWVQIEEADAMIDEDLQDYFRAAHAIVTAKLTKAKRTEIGLADSP